MGKGGWSWAATVLAALGAGDDPEEGDAGLAGASTDGLKVWTRLREWEDGALPPPPDSWPVEPVEARARLVRLLAPGAEPRARQLDYASQAAFAFRPRDEAGAPNIAI